MGNKPVKAREVAKAAEGGQMTAQHLRDLETTRRYATLVAILLETKATLMIKPSICTTG